ncbi:MAG: hypothetical protein OJI67_21065, partial [Prosthecobacter sp.]|nr:hypothetical protein [Prosthecobacter sp.]
ASGVSSIPFDLSYGAEPTDAKETGFAGTLDAAYDTDADLTIDLGFENVPVPTNLGVGNVVFADANGNGHYDTGEGVEGVWMLLYRSGDQPGVATPFASTYTDSEGRYLFTDLPPGGYTVHVAADNFKANLSSLGGVTLPSVQDGPLYNHVSVSGNQSSVADDNLGEDGVDALSPALTGISSPVVILQATQCPTGSVESGFDGSSDDAIDSNYDLTIDFGFVALVGQSAAQDLGIGNVLFKDANNNGIYNSGEGVSGVIMHLYRSVDTPGVSTPLVTVTTDSVGRYLFSNLSSGNYIVHVAADNFKAGVLGLLGNGPLYNYESVTGNQSSTGDDNLGEDGVDAATPALTGISSPVVSLHPGSSATGAAEGGFEGSSDDAKDSDYNLTIDFGFKSLGLLGSVGLPPPAAPALRAESSTASTWQSMSAEIGKPEDDLDSDGAANLLEYALGTDPASGLQTQHFLLQTETLMGHVDAVVIRPSGGRVDVTYDVETSTDLRGGDWQTLTTKPVTSQNNDGTETLRYADVARVGEVGYVRLKVNLDADLNGKSEAEVTSLTQAWVRRDITQQQTFSMPLLAADVFRGVNPEGVKSKLETGRAYYVEVLGGSYAGQRFELDEETMTNSTLAFIDANVPNLTGVPVAIRPHWTVDRLFPAETFHAGTEAGNADRLLFYDTSTGGFLTSWLSAKGWTGDSDGSRIVAPGEGLIIHARNGTVPLTLTGAVRDTSFVMSLKVGVQMIGSGFPVNQSAQMLGLTTEAGFTASTTAAQATRLRLWNGDTSPGDSTYRSLYLNAAPTLWLDEADATGLDVSDQPLMGLTRAWFLVTPTAQPEYVEKP